MASTRVTVRYCAPSCSGRLTMFVNRSSLTPTLISFMSSEASFHDVFLHHTLRVEVRGVERDGAGGHGLVAGDHQRGGGESRQPGASQKVSRARAQQVFRRHPRNLGQCFAREKSLVGGDEHVGKCQQA